MKKYELFQNNIGRIFAVLVLLIVIFSTFVYSTIYISRNKAEIILHLSDTFSNLAFPYKMAKLALKDRDTELQIPLKDVQLSSIADTWHDARTGGRVHEGTDIFAKKGTPIFSATEGFVLHAGTNTLGGNVVWVIGPGGVRYYYAHLERIAEGIKRGKDVTKDTVLGYVGNTGNAATTPPHLHFGVYFKGPENPYPLLVPRI